MSQTDHRQLNCAKECDTTVTTFDSYERVLDKVVKLVNVQPRL
jgi:hypothetical protein